MDARNIAFFVKFEDLDSLCVLLGFLIRKFDSFGFSHSLIWELQINYTRQSNTDTMRLCNRQVVLNCFSWKLVRRFKTVNYSFLIILLVFIFRQQWVHLFATFIFLGYILIFGFLNENLLVILFFITIFISECELYFVQSIMQSLTVLTVAESDLLIFGIVFN